MKKLAIVILFAFAASGATLTNASPTTTNNDDSCDIVTLPAATLLLPYFEVDMNAPQASARTTLITLVNTSKAPQIARVTLWTDLGYPTMNFDLFLTGYDIQPINLYDVFARGIIGSFNGTSSATTPGSRSLPNNANPNFAPSAAADCLALPGPIPAATLADIRTTFITGSIPSCGTAKVGLPHTSAIGYATIDVVRTCGSKFPNDAAYYDDLLFDNVLTGDFQIIDPNAATGNYASGNPLVHIRAIPEGGPAGITATNLPYTFYDRYTPHTTPDSATMDRRQPLPSAFMARFIQGGKGAFNTNITIWREGVTGNNATCADYAKNDTAPSMTVASMVRFDEHENAVLPPICDPRPCTLSVFPETSNTSTSAGLFPPLTVSGDIGGWIFMNLTNHGSSIYSTKPGRDFTGPGITVRQSQNWAGVSMFAEGRYSVGFDATQLANGCSPAPDPRLVGPTGPGPNTTP